MEVQHVARVILGDEKHALVGRDLAYRLVDGICRRGGEDGTANSGVEHPFAHVAAMSGLVARPTAAYQRDLPHLLVRADDDAIAPVRNDVGKGPDQTFDHLGLDVLRLVDELLHDGTPNRTWTHAR